MFDLMIIDDDVNVRARLKGMIQWENLPIRLVCEAGDSDTARELYLLYRPKIIITDICIPIVSGLALAQSLLKLDADIRFIVITGYNDFAYAQQAVKLGAVDLLSKPLFPETINDSLSKAVRYFEAQIEQKASLLSLQQLLQNNLPVIQEKFVINLLHHQPEDPQTVREKLRELRIACRGPRFIVALVCSDYNKALRDSEAMQLLLRDTVTSVLNRTDFEVFTLFDDHFRVCCVISAAQENPDDLVEEAFNKVREELALIAGCQIYAGIGQTVGAPELLFQSFEGASMALNYQRTLGDDTVIHYKNIQRLESQFPTQKSLLSFLLQQFRANNYIAIFTALNQHVYELSTRQDADQRLIREFVFEYVMTITSESLRMGLDVEQVDSYSTMVRSLFGQTDPGELLAYLQSLTRQLLEMLFAKRSQSTNHLIRLAKEYIRENLHVETLNLDAVSDHIGLSRIYFCKLFHKEEGVSFNNFLKQERLELAKQLLTQTNMKVFEISDRTGFSNAKYFGYVFKQVVGLTPLEYQKSQGD